MRWLSGLYCDDVSKFQRGTRLVEPKTSRSEKRCVERHAFGRDALLAEAVALRDADPQRFDAGVGSSTRETTPAVSWFESETRSTPEKSFSVKIESKLKSFAAASKFGRSSWRAIGRVDVEQARLERLPHGAAEEARVALERPCAVDAEGRDDARGARAARRRAAGRASSSRR